MNFFDSNIKLTADDEEPNCIQCDNFDNCDEKRCGPEYGWKNYFRIISFEDYEKEKSNL